MLLADPAESEGRLRSFLDFRYDVVDDRTAHRCLLDMANRCLAADLHLFDMLVEWAPGIPVAIEIRI